MQYIFITYDGYPFPIAKRLMDEGNKVYVSQIEGAEELGVDSGLSDAEDKEANRRRLSLYDGIIKKIPLKRLLKAMENMENKDDYFVIFDFNNLYKIADRVRGMGYTKGIFPNKSDFEREKNRQKSKEFVRENCPGLKVSETKEFNSVEETIKFIMESDGFWVVKSEGNFGETLVPDGDNLGVAREQIISCLEAGEEDYNKSKIIIERKIMKAYEFAPEMVFWNGEPIYSEIEFETRMLGSNDIGLQTGGNQNLIMQTNLNDPINELAFPQAIRDIAKEHVGMFIADAGILSDGNDYYFSEFAGNRWGWGGIFSELSMSRDGDRVVSNYFESVSRGENPYKHRFGSCLAIYNLEPDSNNAGMYKEGRVVVLDSKKAPNLYPYQIRKEVGENELNSRIVNVGYTNSLFAYVVGYGDSINEAVDELYESVEGIALKGMYYRPKCDMISTGYRSSIINRYNFVVDKGLIDAEEYE